MCGSPAHNIHDVPFKLYPMRILDKFEIRPGEKIL
jgi:hypothetical protein